jgi:hypothetical protein
MAASSSTSTSAVAARDWMFCPLSGSLLEMRPGQGAAVCDASGFSRNLADLSRITLLQKSDMKARECAGARRPSFHLQSAHLPPAPPLPSQLLLCCWLP